MPNPTERELKMRKPQLQPKLIPLQCPFCGSKPKVVPSRPDLDGNAWGAVVCTNRKCPAQPQVRDDCNSADERGSGAYKDLAIKRWNKRAAASMAGAQ